MKYLKYVKYIFAPLLVALGLLIGAAVLLVGWPLWSFVAYLSDKRKRERKEQSDKFAKFLAETFEQYEKSLATAREDATAGGTTHANQPQAAQPETDSRPAQAS